MLWMKKRSLTSNPTLPRHSLRPFPAAQALRARREANLPRPPPRAQRSLSFPSAPLAAPRGKQRPRGAPPGSLRALTSARPSRSHRTGRPWRRQARRERTARGRGRGSRAQDTPPRDEAMPTRGCGVRPPGGARAPPQSPAPAVRGETSVSQKSHPAPHSVVQTLPELRQPWCCDRCRAEPAPVP